MRYLNTAITLLLIFFIVQSNIWDNIYSQTQADTPIIIDESLNIEFQISSYNINGMLDYNSQLQIMTLKLYYDLILMQAELMSLQLDLNDFMVTYKRVDKQKCQNILLSSLKAAKIGNNSIGKQRLFLINILFEFIGKKKSSFSKNNLNIYKFQPILFHNTNLTKLQTKINQNLQTVDQDMDIQLQDLDIYFYLYVNSQTGKIQEVHYGQKQQQNIPIKTASAIRKKSVCNSAVRQLTNEQFSKEIMNFLDKNKSNYEKFFKK